MPQRLKRTLYRDAQAPFNVRPGSATRFESGVGFDSYRANPGGEGIMVTLGCWARCDVDADFGTIESHNDVALRAKYQR